MSVLQAIPKPKFLATMSVDWAAVRTIAVTFLTTRFILALVILFSMIVLPTNVQTGLLYADPGNLLVDGLVRFDSWWYHNIITLGYSVGDIAAGEQGNVAFFPLYPLLVKALTPLFGSIFVSGIVISNGAFLLLLCYLYALTKQEFDAETASRTIFYLAAAPTSVFFSAMYTESLYILLVVATFYYARNGYLISAALAGALAAATRNTGIILAAVIVLESWHRNGGVLLPFSWHPRDILEHLGDQIRVAFRSAYTVLAGLLVCVGLLGYVGYLAGNFGDPLAFINAQSGWGRTVSADGMSQVVGNTVGQLNNFLSPSVLIDAGMTLLFLPLTLLTIRKLRLSYFVFVLLTLMIPLSTGTVHSMSRYVLMLFPCFMLLGLWGKRAWVDRLIVGISLPLMAYNAILFSHWYFAG